MKCPVCKTKKAKRQCLLVGSICSACCGSERKKDTCAGCGYYRDPVHNYTDVPAYTTAEMDEDYNLQDIAYVVESAIVAVDVYANFTLHDSFIIRLLERLLDVYHFQEEHIPSDDIFFEEAFEYVRRVIKNDLPDIDSDTMTKILGVMRFVARRRAEGGREHLEFLHRFIGARVDKGLFLAPISLDKN